MSGNQIATQPVCFNCLRQKCNVKLCPFDKHEDRIALNYKMWKKVNKLSKNRRPSVTHLVSKLGLHDDSVANVLYVDSLLDSVNSKNICAADKHNTNSPEPEPSDPFNYALLSHRLPPHSTISASPQPYKVYQTSILSN